MKFNPTIDLASLRARFGLRKTAKVQPGLSYERDWKRLLAAFSLLGAGILAGSSYLFLGISRDEIFQARETTLRESRLFDSAALEATLEDLRRSRAGFEELRRAPLPAIVLPIATSTPEVPGRTADKASSTAIVPVR
jgi:hypothetical protein